MQVQFHLAFSRVTDQVSLFILVDAVAFEVVNQVLYNNNFPSDMRPLFYFEC